MEKVTKDSEDAKQFLDFYIDIIENHKGRTIYYFSENAVLDWFGQTVKGEKNINSFVKSTVSTVTHEFKNVKPVHKIGYRDSHVIQLPVKKSAKYAIAPAIMTQILEDNEKTPPNRPILKDSCDNLEIGQGDGFHVDQNECHSPPKKCRLENGQGDFDAPAPIKFISTEGFIEFHKKSSKKLQAETKWKRPCKLEIAYSTDAVDKYTIHLVIYEGNMKCRKNLLKDFESCESKNDT